VQGFFAGLAWKGFETYSQYSFRNLCLVSVDWVRTASHVHVILSLFNCECHVAAISQAATRADAAGEDEGLWAGHQPRVN